MVKQIEPFMLQKYIANLGPYIYYFNHDCGEYKEKIIMAIKYFSLKYPSLNVLEINWNKYVAKYIHSNYEDKNRVYLYFDGIEIMVLNQPDKDAIKHLFMKCIEYHNLKQDKLAAKIGSRSCQKNKNNKELTSKESKSIEKRVRMILKSKIVTPQETKYDKQNIGDYTKFLLNKSTFESKKNLLFSEDISKSIFNQESIQNDQDKHINTKYSENSSIIVTNITHDNSQYICKSEKNILSMIDTVRKIKYHKNKKPNFDGYFSKGLTKNRNIAKITSISQKKKKNKKNLINIENSNKNYKLPSYIFENDKLSTQINNQFNSEIPESNKNKDKNELSYIPQSPNWFENVEIDDLPFNIINDDKNMKQMRK